MLSYITAASSIAEIENYPLWHPHQLGGNRRGTWSLSVTRNWRLTFKVDEDGIIVDLNLEDYH